MVWCVNVYFCGVAVANIIMTIKRSGLRAFRQVSSNSEASASELLDNLEEVFLLYYMGGVILLTGLNLQTHTGVLPVTRGLKQLKASILFLFVTNPAKKNMT